MSLQRVFPPAVQSTSATNTEEWSLYSAISLSQSGFMRLQWPHQGARNFTKTVLPATASSQVSLVSSVAPATAAKTAVVRATRTREAIPFGVQGRTAGDNDEA